MNHFVNFLIALIFLGLMIFFIVKLDQTSPMGAAIPQDSVSSIDMTESPFLADLGNIQAGISERIGILWEYLLSKAQLAQGFILDYVSEFWEFMVGYFYQLLELAKQAGLEKMSAELTRFLDEARSSLQSATEGEYPSDLGSFVSGD